MNLKTAISYVDPMWVLAGALLLAVAVFDVRLDMPGLGVWASAIALLSLGLGLFNQFFRLLAKERGVNLFFLVHELLGLPSMAVCVLVWRAPIFPGMASPLAAALLYFFVSIALSLWSRGSGSVWRLILREAWLGIKAART